MEKLINKTDKGKRLYLFTQGLRMIPDALIQILTLGHYHGGFHFRGVMKELKKPTKN